MIREATAADAAVLCAAERAIAAVPGALASLPSELIEAAFSDKIVRLNAHPRGRYVVYEDGGRIVGHSSLEPMGPPSSVAHIVRLTMVVHPGFARRGIGRALLSHLIAWARATDGVDQIELNVRAINTAAIGLYRACGFEEEGRLRRRLRTAAGDLDDVLMGLWTGA